MGDGTRGENLWRMFAVGLLLAAGALGLLLRGGYLQIYQHEMYQEQASAEHWKRQLIRPTRGAILDRNGWPLALSLASYRISLDPKSFRDTDARTRTIKHLARLLDQPVEELQDRAAAALPDGPILLSDGVSHQQGLAVQESGLLGVIVEETVRRSYPEGDLGATLLGFVGRNGDGLTGLEADFNRDVGGVPGSRLFERDSVGDHIPFGSLEITPPVNGSQLILTVDRYIQRVAEQRLDDAVKKHQADGGTIIVMDPRTGAILAMASRPTFSLAGLDLSSPPDQELFRNRAITDMYEPGSTFKVMLLASALEDGLVTPETKYFDGGPVSVGGWLLNTWNGGHYGWESMTELLQHSNNIGAVWVAQKLGPERFYHYVKAFGFGQSTNIGLSGEAPGQLRWPSDAEWRPIDLATNAFGQAINVTPLQIVAAVSATVNGGNLMRPFVVKSVDGPQRSRSFAPVVVRRVVSEHTSSQIRMMMNAVAELGVTKMGAVAGYHVGGKTGTANVAEAGGYSGEATIASFVGFGPLDDPAFVALVRIDKPKDMPYGSLVAAPIFSLLAKDIFTHMRIPPAEFVRRIE